MHTLLTSQKLRHTLCKRAHAASSDLTRAISHDRTDRSSVSVCTALDQQTGVYEKSVQPHLILGIHLTSISSRKLTDIRKGNARHEPGVCICFGSKLRHVEWRYEYTERRAAGGPSRVRHKLRSTSLGDRVHLLVIAALDG